MRHIVPQEGEYKDHHRVKDLQRYGVQERNYEKSTEGPVHPIGARYMNFVGVLFHGNSCI